MGKLKALSKPLREKIGGTFGKSNKPNRSGNKADFDPNKHKLNKAQLQKLNDDLADNKALKDAMDGVNGNPELVDSWKVLDEGGVGKGTRTNVDNLEVTGNHLKDNPNSKGQLTDDLKNSSDKDFYVSKIDNIAGPLSKNELGRMNELQYTKSRKAWDGKQLSQAELEELKDLEKRLGSHEYPSFDIPTNSLDDISVKKTTLQVGNKYFWADMTVKNGKVMGLKPDYYNYVITNSGELRIGKGHYHLSGNANTVKAAGGFRVKPNGKITDLDGQSGHYEPSASDISKAGNLFRSLNLLED
jgi:hypothetical protein